MDLPESNLTMAPRGLLRRGQEAGTHELSRVRLGEAWALEALVAEQTDRTEVVAHTDLFSGERGRFESVPLNQVAPGRYRLINEPRRAGVYHYQLRMSRDGGSSWLCERLPYGRVHVEPAAVHDLRMYSLIPRISGSFTDWTGHLARIRDLGFNAVHLLPVTKPGGSKSPYAANHLFEIDPAYADPNDSRPPLIQFEGFVHEARRLGLRLCLDLVVNHVAVDGRIARHRPDWIVPDDEEIDGFKRAGFWMGRQWIKWGDLALLDHRHPNPAVREELHNHILHYVRYWARYAAETEGMVRLDNTHSTDEGFLRRLLNELHETYPRLGVLAELFADPQTAERLVWDQGVHLLLGTLWEMPYAAQTRQYLHQLHKAHPKLRYYLPITSPDSGSPAEEYGSDEATGPRYAVAALMGTGCTGSVQGVEW
ncbi:MAG: alpha-amylase family glycosyl hydrolase, partial [Phycisphaeraceae bacterium]|nr:alpha-amylase family glycosyl hydrolase [Phycisphaeraceae bacterium]